MNAAKGAVLFVQGRSEICARHDTPCVPAVTDTGRPERRYSGVGSEDDPSTGHSEGARAMAEKKTVTPKDPAATAAKPDKTRTTERKTQRKALRKNAK